MFCINLTQDYTGNLYRNDINLYLCINIVCQKFARKNIINKAIFFFLKLDFRELWYGDFELGNDVALHRFFTRGLWNIPKGNANH